jgi:hypothetical protein
MKESIIVLAVSMFAIILPMQEAGAQDKLKTGAWMMKEATITYTLVIADDYFSITAFDLSGKKFLYTYGGTAKPTGRNMEGNIEYHSADKSMVGKKYNYPVEINTGSLTVTRDNKVEKWQQTDDGKSALTGYWRIIRRDDNAMNPGARKTIKLLSGKRFQWAAINTQTGDFFGTGGGNYTFENGKYTEHIEFFSRDSSRVGMSLSFDGKVEGKQWFHSGLSSKGDKINEVWTRE